MKVIYGEKNDINEPIIVEQKINDDTTVRYLCQNPVMIETGFIRFDVLGGGGKAEPSLQIHKFNGEISIPYKNIEFLIIDGVDYTPFIKNRKIFRSLSNYNQCKNTVLTPEEQYHVNAGLYPLKTYKDVVSSEVLLETIENKDFEEKVVSLLEGISDVLLENTSKTDNDVSTITTLSTSIIEEVVVDEKTLESNKEIPEEETVTDENTNDEKLSEETIEDSNSNIEVSESEDDNQTIQQQTKPKKAGRPSKK